MSTLDFKTINFKGLFMASESERDIETLKEFHRVLRRTLRPPVYSVFCAIEDHAGPNSPEGLPAYTCFASDKTLAAEANVSRATVIRAVEELTELGLIKVENREGYSSLIWPLVTNYGYRWFMEEEQKRELQKETGITEQQGVLHRATGGVAQSDTNETKLKKPKNESNTTTTDVVGEVPSPEARLPDLEILSITDSPPDKASQPASGYEPEPKKVRNQGADKPKTSKEPEFAKDPRIGVWRKYALECHYKFWPNEQERNLILSQIPNDELHIARWERLIQKWIDDEHGYKIFNIKGLVSVYVRGWRKNQNYQRGIYQ